jgi:hypothetical protein
VTSRVKRARSLASGESSPGPGYGRRPRSTRRTDRRGPDANGSPRLPSPGSSAPPRVGEEARSWQSGVLIGLRQLDRGMQHSGSADGAGLRPAPGLKGFVTTLQIAAIDAVGHSSLSTLHSRRRPAHEAPSNITRFRPCRAASESRQGFSRVTARPTAHPDQRLEWSHACGSLLSAPPLSRVAGLLLGTTARLCLARSGAWRHR